VVSALIVGSLSKVRKGRRMGDQNLLFGATLCFGKHVKLLVPAVFAVVSNQSQVVGINNRKHLKLT
jgi:hypothetical protein